MAHKTHLKNLCFALLLSLLFASITSAQPAKRPPPNVQTALKGWFHTLQKRLDVIRRALPKASKAQRHSLLLELAKEYQRVVKMHRLLIRKYNTYKGTRQWPKLKKLSLEARRQAQLFRVRSAQIYRQLLDEYPKHPKTCEVQHGLADQLWYLGKAKLAAQVYRQLLQDDTKGTCRHTDRAKLVIAESLFDQGKCQPALVYYKKLFKAKQPAHVIAAKYKTGWCLYSEKKYDQALPLFVGAMFQLKQDAAKIPPEERTAFESNLRKFLVVTSARHSNPMIATQLLPRLDSLAAPLMLRAVAKELVKQKRWKQVDAMYGYFKKQVAGTPKALLVKLRWISVQLKRKPKRFLEAIKMLQAETASLVKMVNTLRAKYTDNPTYQRAAKAAQRALLALGKKAHRRKGYRSAITLYGAYLDAFGKTKGAAKAYFWRAEAMMAMQQTQAAAEDYQRSFQRDPKSPLAASAAYNTAVIYTKLAQRAFSRSPYLEDDDDKPKKTPLPITRMLRACEAFAKAFPKDARTPRVLFAQAQMNQQIQRTKAARQLYFQVAQRYPKKPISRQAAQALLQTAKQERNWNALSRWSWKLSQLPGWKGQSISTQMADIWFSIELQLCQRFSAQAQWRRTQQCLHKLAPKAMIDPKRGVIALSQSIQAAKQTKQTKALRALLDRYKKRHTQPRGQLFAAMLERAYQRIQPTNRPTSQPTSKPTSRPTSRPR